MKNKQPTHRSNSLIAEASPEKLEDRAKSHRKSAAKYRAAHRGELKHKEWRRRPQYVSFLNLDPLLF